VVVLEKDGGSFESGARASDHLALDHTLCLLLGQEQGGGQSKRSQRSKAAEQR
jgi:hypothetical protein